MGVVETGGGRLMIARGGAVRVGGANRGTSATTGVGGLAAGMAAAGGGRFTTERGGGGMNFGSSAIGVVASGSGVIALVNVRTSESLTSQEANRRA